MSAVQSPGFAAVEMLRQVGPIEHIQVSHLGAFSTDYSKEVPCGYFKGFCGARRDGDCSDASQILTGGLQQRKGSVWQGVRRVSHDRLRSPSFAGICGCRVLRWVFHGETRFDFNTLTLGEWPAKVDR